MAVVFSNEVVQIRLVQEFIAVDVVEQSSQPDESAGWEKRKDEAVLGEEPFQTWNCLQGFAFCDQLAVHVDKEVKHEAVDDRVNLEVNAQTVQDAAKNVPFFQDKIYGEEYEKSYDVVVWTTGRQAANNWVEKH